MADIEAVETTAVENVKVKPAPKVKAVKTPKVKPAKIEKPAKDEINGIVRPSLKTITGRIWNLSDTISRKFSRPALRREVLEACKDEAINPATVATQYGRWRKYNGLTGRGEEVTSEETTSDAVESTDDVVRDQVATTASVE